MSEQQARQYTADEYKTENEPKYYRCHGCGLIVGHIQYHNRIARLHLRATEYFIVYVTGDADIVCMQCGYTTHWSPSAAAMADMLRRRRDRIEKYEKELADG